jgi:hypothetical protein
MADRYDIDRDRDRDRERSTWDRDRERGREWGREFSGSERSGDRRHEDWDRDRDRGWRSSEGRQGEARYEDYGQQRRGGGDEGWRDTRYSGSERGDYGNRGDWGRQGSWGSFGNRPDYNRENDWRESRGQDNMGRTESDFGGARSGRTNLFGTGGGGFGTGFSSYGAGMGPYGAGGYTGGMGAYGERERGERERGRFTGRGPKGWQRSDDRIREDINERLTDHPHVDASEIEVTVKNGEVTLTGTVDERHAKRLAEDIAESVSGVREVHNQIRVQHQTQDQLTTQRDAKLASQGTTGTTGRNR